MHITIYTDGSALGNPGPGGWAAILTCKNHYKEVAGGYRKTTNNRMELLAVIRGLECVKVPSAEITIFSDSKYVVDSIMKRWVFDWEKKGFKGKKNIDLWKQILRYYRKYRLNFVWVKGHDGNKKNEQCDKLANMQARLPNLPPDQVYEEVNEKK